MENYQQYFLFVVRFPHWVYAYMRSVAGKGDDARLPILQRKGGFLFYFRGRGQGAKLVKYNDTQVGSYNQLVVGIVVTFCGFF